jgi:preprotein translocase subunit SecG
MMMTSVTSSKIAVTYLLSVTLITFVLVMHGTGVGVGSLMRAADVCIIQSVCMHVTCMWQ